MADTATKEEKEKKRRKQLKRMGKILARAWELDEAFQEDPKSSPDHVLDLTSIGQKIDQKAYRLGRHGWEDFACDLGGVYNRHIHRCVFTHIIMHHRCCSHIGVCERLICSNILFTLLYQQKDKESGSGKKIVRCGQRIAWTQRCLVGKACFREHAQGEWQLSRQEAQVRVGSEFAAKEENKTGKQKH